MAECREFIVAHLSTAHARRFQDVDGLVEGLWPPPASVNGEESAIWLLASQHLIRLREFVDEVSGSAV
jgi:hypothetical protein